MSDSSPSDPEEFRNVPISGTAAQQLKELIGFLEWNETAVIEESLKLLATAAINGLISGPAVPAYPPAIEAFRLWRTLHDIGEPNKLRAFTNQGAYTVNIPRAARRAFQQTDSVSAYFGRSTALQALSQVYDQYQ